ncbi:hypothetical protein LCGC14_1833960 [marine sediment metagenome]|uniref:Uncharacterized protein n=1 Tax=marine sediment metagenome TaxID=412755 RepID=A0A0F9H3F1_9ZZZZ
MSTDYMTVLRGGLDEDNLGKLLALANPRLHRFVADAVERDHLEGNDYLKCIITAVGSIIESTYSHTLTITVPRLAYRALPIGFEDGMALYSIEANVFHDSSSGYPLDITVRNNTVALLN